MNNEFPGHLGFGAFGVKCLLSKSPYGSYGTIGDFYFQRETLRILEKVERICYHTIKAFVLSQVYILKGGDAFDDRLKQLTCCMEN